MLDTQRWPFFSSHSVKDRQEKDFQTCWNAPLSCVTVKKRWTLKLSNHTWLIDWHYNQMHIWMVRDPEYVASKTDSSKRIILCYTKLHDWNFREKRNSATTKLVVLPIIKGVHVLISHEMNHRDCIPPVWRQASISPCLFDTEDTSLRNKEENSLYCNITVTWLLNRWHETIRDLYND